MKKVSHCPIQRSPDRGSKPGQGQGVRGAVLGLAWGEVGPSQLPRLGDEGTEEAAETFFFLPYS